MLTVQIKIPDYIQLAIRLYSELIRRAELNSNRVAMANSFQLAPGYNLEILRLRINELLLADYLCPVNEPGQDNSRGVIDLLFPELGEYEIDELTGIKRLGIDFVINNPELTYTKSQIGGSCAYKRYFFGSTQIERSQPFPDNRAEKVIFKVALEKSLLALANGIISQLTSTDLYEARMNGRSRYLSELRKGDMQTAASALAAYELLTEAHEAIHKVACSMAETAAIISCDISYRKKIAKAGFLRLGLPWRD